jgi:glycosyltransferase involved in cell wall biosynthesis
MELRSGGLERAAAYTWERAARETRDLYGRVAGGRAPGEH